MEDDGEGQKPPGAVESDPKKRFWRFEDVLGRGAFKTVFKAFDSREGTEVAWNKVQLGTAVNEDQLRKRLFSEIHVLKRLKHKNIMTFHDYWLDDRTNTLNFITELFTHGSLKKFRAKHKHLELKVLKKWAWQVLQGLVYLHGHDPPIIHRDLKCDNILINGVTGDLKIGDLGLATLWRGISALSVIGTPEFMAPEFYDEKYDEKVDVYAFGMLLLELVSMDYPYCECTNPAAIYKKVSNGVLPGSIQKIRNQELRKFIELCIAYEPFERPEARKLLKHPFFDSVRRIMEAERQSSEEIDIEHLVHRSDSSGSVDTKMGPLSRHCSAVMHYTEDSEGDAEDDRSDSTSSDGVKIRIECSKEESQPILNFTLKYNKPGGELKTIQFPFNIEDDTAEQIVAEMLAAGPTDLDILITEEEAATIGELIALEVERWKLKDEGELTAYVNVLRKPCDSVPDSPRNVVPVDSLEAMEVVESKMDDICQTVASDMGEDNVFRTLRRTSLKLMDYIAADSTRPSLKNRLEVGEDEIHSDGALTEKSVLFPQKAEMSSGMPTPRMLTPRHRRSLDERSAGSDAIDIPNKRQVSGWSSFDNSNSFSSAVSDSRLNSAEGRSPFIGSIQRRASQGQPSGSMRRSFLRSMSMTVEGNSHPIASPAKIVSSQTPVEVSVIVVDPKPDVESHSNTPRHEGAAENEMGQDARQGNNTSLISMVTMKATSKKPIEGSMPTVPEMSAPQSTNVSSTKPVDFSQKLGTSAARSKADAWQWNLAHGLAHGSIFSGAESATNASRTLSVGISPQSSFRRQGSYGSTIDHGMKSPLSQDVDSCTRSELNSSLASLSKLAEGIGMASGTSSVGVGQSVAELRDLEMHGHTQGPLISPQCGEKATEHVVNRMKSFPLTADALSWHAAFADTTPDDCKSAFELAFNSTTESIRAFRRDDGMTMSSEASQRVSRMFSSCAQLSHMYPESADFKQQLLFSSTPGFDQVFHPTPAEVALVHMAHPHPFLNLAPPVNPRVSSRDLKSRYSQLHPGSDEFQSWADFGEDSIVPDIQKQNTDSKEFRRQKAAENIDKMQEQQLAGLCSGAAVGVSRSKAVGRKKQRPSMNGT